MNRSPPMYIVHDVDAMLFFFIIVHTVFVVRSVKIYDQQFVKRIFKFSEFGPKLYNYIHKFKYNFILRVILMVLLDIYWSMA
jgi:hypothetical protein